MTVALGCSGSDPESFDVAADAGREDAGWRFARRRAPRGAKGAGAMVGAPSEAGTDARDAGAGGSGGAAGGDGGTGGRPSASAMGSDTFDPDRIYLLGTLQEGLCGRNAIALLEEPESGLVGFDCYLDGHSAQIDPDTGRLLYKNTFEDVLREFHCDSDCSAAVDALDYPATPLTNDEILETPPCSPDTDPMTRALLAPDGSRVHRCSSGATWYDEAGNERYTPGPAPGTLDLQHLGNDGLAFAESHLVDLASGSEIAITGLPSRQVLAVRATEQGFRVVIRSALLEDRPERWEVGPDGAATKTGVYPLPPEDYATWGPGVLDAGGALYQEVMWTGGSTADAIVRRTLDGDSEVVYTEASMPRVMMHGSNLVTGP